MTEYLDVQDVLAIAKVVLEPFGMEVKIRDYGLLQSAVARPQAGGFGIEAYPDLFEKAAALLHSLASNHSLIDGNKRTAWTVTAVFVDINDHELLEPLNEDAAEELVLEVAQSRLDVPEIARRLRPFFS
ncbi:MULTISPECIES: type II toxin-antitoxin system death-on-curing family toxin [unclassified Kitasatospora]|uniref:type II toxin-antitoxin system death-on-curing family toxin n=1 Tax=unclassified Kitasatospora TaxID=2633591 RepID=UPI002476DC04|nr:type II toxin-antitoxin system death-on-curing family toxin [Kitasatospora sp. MAP12-44]